MANGAPNKTKNVGDAIVVQIEIHECRYSLGGLGEVVSEWQRQYPPATMFDIVLVRCEGGLDPHNWGDAAIAALAHICSQIRSLTMDTCNVTSVSGLLKGMRRIQELRLRSCTGLTTVEFFGGMNGSFNLTLIDLSDCRDLTSIEELFWCIRLNTLRLRGCTALVHVRVSACLNLHTLNLSGCCNLSDIKDIGNSEELRILDLR